MSNNGKNIANYDTFNQLLANSEKIQSSGVGLEIYATNASTPAYSFDPFNLVCNINGKFNVLGDATFSSFTIMELSNGIIKTGHNNTSDAIDLGLSSTYVNAAGTTLHTGIVRDVTDVLRRWTFFDNILAVPTQVVTGINQTTLASVRLNQVYVNDGTALLPSIVFDTDNAKSTGFYKILTGDGGIGITVNGAVVASITRSLTQTISNISLAPDTTLQLQRLDTVGDSILSAGITTGHIYIGSTSANDKWFKFYSNTGAATPSYAGSVFSSPTNHYFTANTGSALTISGRINAEAENIAPDYRKPNTTILSINLNNVESKLPVILPLGTLSNLSLQFSNENTTGLYRSGLNALGIVCSSTNILNISALNVTISKPLYVLDGLVTMPSISFTNSPGLGIYSSSLNTLNISANSINRITINSTGTTFNTGSIINIGTTGTTTPANIFGLISGYNGLTISAGSSSVQALIVNGLLTLNNGLTFTNGSILSVGTSGITSTLNVFGAINGNNGINISSGLTYIGGSLQFPTNAMPGYILTSDATGNASWSTPMFGDGTVLLPSIVFTNDTSTGLYRIGNNNIGITTSGVKRIDISNTSTKITNDLYILSGFSHGVTILSTNTLSLTTVHNIVEVTNTSNTTITLPSIVGNAGRHYVIINSGTGTVTVNTISSSEYIDNGINTTIVLNNQYDRLALVGGSTQWYSM